MIIKDLVESSVFTEIKLDEAANIHGGLGLLPERSIISQVFAQHQLNTNGFTNIAGYGRVILTQHRGWVYSLDYSKYVPLF